MSEEKTKYDPFAAGERSVGDPPSTRPYPKPDPFTGDNRKEPSSNKVLAVDPLAVDPWMHRSKFMSCASCMWWVEKASTSESPKVLGRCRKHAPTMSGYPAAFANDWCGDHKLDENRV